MAHPGGTVGHDQALRRRGARQLVLPRRPRRQPRARGRPDPTRDVTEYARAAETQGLRLAYSLETHLHADFVSGSRELARLGATVLAPRSGRIEFPHRGLDDEEEVDLGGLTLRAVGTPGHTPEPLGYLLLDGPRPVALFSGGALHVGQSPGPTSSALAMITIVDQVMPWLIPSR